MLWSSDNIGLAMIRLTVVNDLHVNVRNQSVNTYFHPHTDVDRLMIRTQSKG